MIDVMRKKLQLRKYEASKYEIEIKIAERLEDIERLKKQVNEWQESIDKVKAEIDSMEE